MMKNQPESQPAKLVLGRKGFDLVYGGCASPILPDGQLVSLPIPQPDGRIRYGELHPRGIDVGQLVADLSKRKLTADSGVHLDPDLDLSTCARKAGWRPAFGQDGSAQRHLEKQDVTDGDLFLFLGWFNEIDFVDGRYRFAPKAPDLHVMFGWLQVGSLHQVGVS